MSLLASRVFAGLGTRSAMKSTGVAPVLLPALRKTTFRSYSQDTDSKVTELPDITQVKNFLNADKVSVLDFYATWCGPCKMMEPIFEKLASSVPELQFGRVDVDTNLEAATEYGVTAMPTCIFFKQGQILEKIVGANPSLLASLLKKHAKDSS